MKETFTLILTNGAKYTVSVYISQDTKPSDIQESIADFLNPFKMPYLHYLEYFDIRDNISKKFSNFIEYNDENIDLLNFIINCNII